MGFFKPTYSKIALALTLSGINFLIIETPIGAFFALPALFVGLVLNPPFGAPLFPQLASFIQFIGHYSLLAWLYLAMFNAPVYYFLSCTLVFLATKQKKLKTK